MASVGNQWLSTLNPSVIPNTHSSHLVVTPARGAACHFQASHQLSGNRLENPRHFWDCSPTSCLSKSWLASDQFPAGDRHKRLGIATPKEEESGWVYSPRYPQSTWDCLEQKLPTEPEGVVTTGQTARGFKKQVLAILLKTCPAQNYTKIPSRKGTCRLVLPSPLTPPVKIADIW